MENKFKTTRVCSVGGSIIAPEGGIDVDFLVEFSKFVRRHVKKGVQFYLICGGGDASRRYQTALRSVSSQVSESSVDQLGVEGTRMNGHLLRLIFGDLAYPRLITDSDKFDQKSRKYAVVLGAGHGTGWSSDYWAVSIAKQLRVSELINLSNTKGVYDIDPNKNSNARLFTRLSWDRVIKMVGTVWRPGLNRPFDPIAAQKAKSYALKVITCDGHDLSNVERIFSGQPFIGTVIE